MELTINDSNITWSDVCANLIGQSIVAYWNDCSFFGQLVDFNGTILHLKKDNEHCYLCISNVVAIIVNK